jgi:hypothetical protein
VFDANRSDSYTCMRILGECTPPASSMEPSYRHLRATAQQGDGTGLHRGDVLVVLPDGELSIVDVVVTHPAGQSAVVPHPRALAPPRKRRRMRNSVHSGALRTQGSMPSCPSWSSHSAAWGRLMCVS